MTFGKQKHIRKPEPSERGESGYERRCKVLWLRHWNRLDLSTYWVPGYMRCYLLLLDSWFQRWPNRDRRPSRAVMWGGSWACSWTIGWLLVKMLQKEGVGERTSDRGKSDWRLCTLVLLKEPGSVIIPSSLGRKTGLATMEMLSMMIMLMNVEIAFMFSVLSRKLAFLEFCS